MRSQQPHAARQLRIAGRDHAALAGGDAFVAEKAEAAGFSKASAALPGESRARGLRGVFDEEERIGYRQCRKLIRVRGNAGVVDSKNSLRPRGDLRGPLRALQGG